MSPVLPAGASASPTRGLKVMLPVTNAAFIASTIAATSILLPLQVQAAVGGDVTQAAIQFGILSSLGAAVAVVASPLMGSVSDRTTWRTGRRNSWILIGAVVGSLIVGLLGLASSVLALTIGWCAAQWSLNAMLAALNATIPDRVPIERRGTYSSLFALGLPIGSLLGAAIGGVFVGNIPVAYGILAALLLAAGVAFFFLSPEPVLQSRAPEPTRRDARLRAAFAAFGSHDFRWAFIARFAIVLGGFLYLSQQVFYLQDVVGMSTDEAGRSAAMLTALMVLGMLIGISISGPWSDRAGRRKPFVIAAAVIVSGAALLPLLAPSLLSVAVFIVLLGVGIGIYQAVDYALMTQVLPSADDAGKDMGFLNVAGVVPQVLAPAFAAAIAVLFGFQALFVGVIFFAMLGGLAIVPIRGVR